MGQVIITSLISSTANLVRIICPRFRSISGGGGTVVEWSLAQNKIKGRIPGFFCCMFSVHSRPPLAGVGDNLHACYAKSRDTEREGRGEPLSLSKLKRDGEKDQNKTTKYSPSCSAQTVTRIGLLEEIPRSGVKIPCLS